VIPWLCHTSLPFLAFLMKPDVTVLEINAEMLGFNPQTIEIEDDQIIVKGMSGLNPKQFIINLMATDTGELLVETKTESIEVKTLIPLQ